MKVASLERLRVNGVGSLGLGQVIRILTKTKKILPSYLRKTHVLIFFFINEVHVYNTRNDLIGKGCFNHYSNTCLIQPLA